MSREGAPKPKITKESAPEADMLAEVLEGLKTKAGRARALRKFGIKQPDA